MKKILVPCDFSAPAIQAYKFAMDIACTSHGEVLVLRVIDLPFLYESAFGVQPLWHDPSLDRKLEEQSKEFYEKMKEMYAEVQAPVNLLIERGSVRSTILSIIKARQIDLVVMGTHGSGSQGSFIGTNTARIVRSSPVPVISLRKATDISTIKIIVFPTTLELDQTEFVSKVKSLQVFFNAILHVVFINTPSNFHDDKYIVAASEAFVKHYELKDHIFKTTNDVHELEGIMNYCSEVKADMIAIGTHGRKGISHVLYGSIAEDVVNHAVCPVWSSILAK